MATTRSDIAPTALTGVVQRSNSNLFVASGHAKLGHMDPVQLKILINLKRRRRVARKFISMNPLRSILVHLDGTDGAAVRLAIARQLAAAHNSTVDVLFAVEPRCVPRSRCLNNELPLRVDPRHRDYAMGLFAQGLPAGAGSGGWHELSGEAPIPGFVRRALLSDLMVLGQRNPADKSAFDIPPDFVEAVIVDSGRPAIIVPLSVESGGTPRTALVAWQPTRESARALTAAVPFLQQAEQVHLVCMTEDIVQSRQAFMQAKRYLRLHGIENCHHDFGPGGRDIGQGLVSLAASLGVDLLVMGCYGHSRARERVLGGVTRTVLRVMSMPVLMVH